MPYQTEHLIPLDALKQLAAITISELNTLTLKERSLRTQLQTLEARQDADITAATEDSEVIDGRVDAWGNEHGSLGTNIRAGQSRFVELLEGLTENLQAQIQDLAEVRIEGILAGISERRKQDLARETEDRTESDIILQKQIDELSETEMRISVMLSEIREALREIKGGSI